jgi:hypothetical protein
MQARDVLRYICRLQAGHCGLPVENMHPQLGLCITGHGATVQPACLMQGTPPTSIQIQPTAPWSWVEPYQFAVAPHFMTAGSIGAVGIMHLECVVQRQRFLNNLYVMWPCPQCNTCHCRMSMSTKKKGE